MKSRGTIAGQIGAIQPCRGFTLLEVVVATAVLAIGVAAAMQVFSGGLANLHHIEMSHRAMSHAENIMSRLLADEDIRGPYHESGDLDDDFFYEAQADYWEDPNPSSTMLDPALPAASLVPRVYLLSISVTIGFKNPKNNVERQYRAWCLKSVSEEQDGAVQRQIDPSQRLEEILRGRR